MYQPWQLLRQAWTQWKLIELFWKESLFICFYPIIWYLDNSQNSVQVSLLQELKIILNCVQTYIKRHIFSSSPYTKLWLGLMLTCETWIGGQWDNLILVFVLHNWNPQILWHWNCISVFLKFLAINLVPPCTSMLSTFSSSAAFLHNSHLHITWIVLHIGLG